MVLYLAWHYAMLCSYRFSPRCGGTTTIGGAVTNFLSVDYRVGYRKATSRSILLYWGGSQTMGLRYTSGISVLAKCHNTNFNKGEKKSQSAISAKKLIIADEGVAASS